MKIFYKFFNLDEISNEEDANTADNLKRELKRQGILERIKNKMEHDLGKYGWD